MEINESLQLFEDQPIRAAWDNDAEEWYFSIVDVVGALTEQETKRGASTYWAVLKNRLKNFPEKAENNACIGDALSI